MTNSITFSPDLNLLYLIDDGRAITFALNKRNGVLVTVLRGQLTVVSAPEINRRSEEEHIDEADIANIPTPVSKPELKFPPFPQKLSVPVTGNQWSVFFNPDHNVLGIIGATDIGGAIEDEAAPRTLISLFPLRERILNIRREGDRLEFLSIRF